MARSNNLYRRNGTYYARIYVPKDLVVQMCGKSEVWRSLRTRDHAEAKRRLSAELDQWSATFDELRRESRELTEDDVVFAAWDHYRRGVEAGDQERANRPTEQQIERAFDAAIDSAQRSGAAQRGGTALINAMTDAEILASKAAWGAKWRSKRLARLRADLGSGDTRLIEPVVDEFLSSNRFSLARDSMRYRDLCFRFMRAEIEQLKRYEERDKGDFSGKPADPLIVEPINVSVSPGVGQSIMERFSKYERENPNGIRPESMKQARHDVQHFALFVGDRVAAGEIKKAHVREWKDLLSELPRRASETAAFKDLRLAKVVAANKQLAVPKPTLSRQTVRRYLSNLGGFCGWLQAHDYLQTDPVAGMLPKKAPPTVRRNTFSDEQLKGLFGSPLFVSCQGAEWRDLHRPGEVEVRDHRYWIPWVMLYSGARPAEVAQLHVGDVREQESLWVMHINDEGDEGKRTKTKGSVRLVPVHSELVRLGFIEHCRAAELRGDRQIFPELVIPKEGQIAAQFSREFNRYLKRVGVKNGPDLVTYGLRHTFIDRARLAGRMDQEIGLIVGHAQSTMTAGYGVEQEGVLKLRSQIVEAVSYPCLADLMR